jgi:ribonuclease P protein component
MERRLRLRRSQDFLRLRQQGHSSGHRMLAFNYMANGLPNNRYGFITSKRLGNAVTRNRVRRILREVVRSLHPHLNTGYDIVIVARPAIVGQPLTVIQRIITEKAHQAGLLSSVESDLL